MFTQSELGVIKYCAEECERQGSGEASVYDMLNAWRVAFNIWDNLHIRQPRLDIEFIESMGKLVEPVDNKNGFRRIPIGVSNGYNWIEKARWERVPELLQLLLDSYYEGNLTHIIENKSYTLARTAEDQFYYEFEEIHPFRDGNGRTGKILYNYLNDTLGNPIIPPNFWGGSNP